jgi:hypothetical protein
MKKECNVKNKKKGASLENDKYKALGRSLMADGSESL